MDNRWSDRSALTNTKGCKLNSVLWQNVPNVHGLTKDAASECGDSAVKVASDGQMNFNTEHVAVSLLIWMSK